VPPLVIDRVSEDEPRVRSFLATVAGTFMLGWVLGVVAVLKLWQLSGAPRWMMVTGAGYVIFMILPIASGFALTKVLSRLISRGWTGSSLGFLVLGLCALVAGLFTL
jgi:hypothetical protein